jgi:hypothetical protein
MTARHLFLVCITLLLACGEETTSESKPFVVPNLTYGSYDVNSIRLDVPVDELDLAVLAGRPPLVDKVNTTFDTLALHLFFVDLGFAAGCLDNDADAYRLPAMATEALEKARARGLTMEKVAVHVELLTPSRLPSMGSDVPVLGICGSDGGRFPTFGQPTHRAQLLADFEALASLPGLDRVTVGVDMNALYHAGDAGEFGYDFSNYVTAYRDIYSSLKSINANFEVGVGLDFRVFVQKTIPYAAQMVLGKEECMQGSCALGSELPDAVYEAFRLVVAPLVSFGLLDDQTPTADFVSWSVIPASADAPFGGSPSFDELEGAASATRRQSIVDYFKPLLYVSSWLQIPYYVHQADWSGSRGKQEKGVFLDVMLTSLSPNLPSVLGWRRLTDLPRDEIAGGGSNNSICSQIVNPGRPEFKRPEDYCSGGLVDSNGSEGSYGTDSVLERLSASGG